MPQRRDGDGNATGMLQTSDASLMGMEISPDQLEAIRTLGDGSVTAEDIFGFRMVASGDGLDFYFTRQAESSMRNFVKDLKAGQSVLGSHDIGTFSYGQSFGAALVKADPTQPGYEGTFYRQFDKPELRTTQLVVGDYFLVRHAEYNGQKTDDLIRGIKFGAQRKASISFTVGRYVCGVDGVNMLDGWFGPWPDEEEGCTHFPGVEYKKDALAWAWMEDANLMETSIVYKNASPSALLMHKADLLAKTGRLPREQIAALESRLAHRLPDFQKRTFGGVEVPMGDENRGTPPAAPPAGPPDPEARIAEFESRLTVITTRDTAIEEILGGPGTLTVEGIRSLTKRAATGDELYDALIDKARAAKIRALGAESFDADKYVGFLKATRDVPFVQSEIDNFEKVASKTFTPGRTVDPGEVTDSPAPLTTAPFERESILPDRSQKRS